MLRRGLLPPPHPVREHLRAKSRRRQLNEDGMSRSGGGTYVECQMRAVPPIARERLNSTLCRHSAPAAGMALLAPKGFVEII